MPTALKSARRELADENKKWPAELREIPPHQWPGYLPETLRIPARVLRSRTFLVQIYASGDGRLRLSANRTQMNDEGDWKDGITWDDLYRLKREAGYGSWWATMRDGEWSAAPTPAGITSESDSGYWPTATATDGRRQPSGIPRTHPNAGFTLNDAVLMWPTPRASDGEKGGPNQAQKGKPALSALANWPTPCAADASKGGVAFARGNPTLRGAALWSTPMHSDGTAGPQATDVRPSGSKGTRNLSGQVLWPTPNATASNDGEGTETWDARRRRVQEKGINGNGMGEPLAIASRRSGGGHASDAEPGLGRAGVDALAGGLDWPAARGCRPAAPGQPQEEWEPPRTIARYDGRADRLRIIGNGWDPYAAALAWRLLGGPVNA